MGEGAAGAWLGLIGAWLLFFASHSALAAEGTKRALLARWPGLGPWYRILYNLLALLLLAPAVLLTHRLDGVVLWRWEGAWGWLADGLALAAAAGFLWTLRGYDGQEILGLRQLREGRPVLEEGPLVIGPLHRCVRHPWYFLGLVILWTRDMDAAFLAAAVLLTAYLAVGARLEEARLLRRHGEAYRRYRERVPFLLPRPGRCLSAEEAARLEALAREGAAGSSGTGEGPGRRLRGDGAGGAG